MAERTCSIEGCVNPPRSLKCEWCEKHYMRWYRHGDPNAKLLGDGFTLSKGRRYLSAYLPRHPLATKNGKVYLHRAALFDTIGAGPHLCHWCGRSLTWGRSLVVDHLDGYGDNNEPSNLVPSCHRCNITRAARATAQARRAQGQWDGMDARRTHPQRPSLLKNN